MKTIRFVASMLLALVIAFSGLPELSGLSASGYEWEPEPGFAVAYEFDFMYLGLSGKLLSSKPPAIIITDLSNMNADDVYAADEFLLSDENTVGKLTKMVFEVGTVLKFEPGFKDGAPLFYNTSFDLMESYEILAPGIIELMDYDLYTEKKQASAARFAAAHEVELTDKMLGKRVSFKVNGLPYDSEAYTMFEIEVIPEGYDYQKQLPIAVVYNGRAVDFPRPAIEKNGFLFYPLEDVLQALCGGHVWDEDTYTLSGEHNGNIVEVPVKGTNYWVNGVILDVPAELRPFVENDIAYVYLDYIIEGLDLPVVWDDVTRTVIIGSDPYWISIDSLIRVAPSEPYKHEQAAPVVVESTPKPLPKPSPKPSENSKVAYITIDDGPSYRNTPAILDILKSYGIKATFFVLPHDGVDEIYKRISDEGHDLGNHSFSHNYSLLYSDDPQVFKDDVLKMHRYIQNKAGYTSRVFRFPGGSRGRSDDILNPRKEILNDLGYRYFDWDVTTGDTDTGPAGKDVNALINNVANNTQNRNRLIILMHDAADKTTTVKALPGIIERLVAQNYVFDTLTNY